MEDGSVLSMESNEDPREIYELAGEGQHDHLGEDYTDYDGFEGSLSMSDDESERLIHPHDNPLHIYPHAHHGNIAGPGMWLSISGMRRACAGPNSSIRHQRLRQGCIQLFIICSLDLIALQLRYQ